MEINTLDDSKSNLEAGLFSIKDLLKILVKGLEKTVGIVIFKDVGCRQKNITILLKLLKLLILSFNILLKGWFANIWGITRKR